jgi:type VI secretion system protein ImpM
MGNELTVGWYGKLPSTGDFAGRGLNRDCVQTLDTWLQNGLAQLRLRLPDWQSFYVSAPCWSFLVPAKILAPHPVFGCIAPSADRVGRLFPIVTIGSVGASAMIHQYLPPKGRFHLQCTELIELAISRQTPIEEFDQQLETIEAELGAVQRSLAQRSNIANDILDILGANATPMDDNTIVPLQNDDPLTRRNLQLLTQRLKDFDGTGNESYWWSNIGTPSPAFVSHQSTPNSQLFYALFTQMRRSGANSAT